MAAFDPDKWLSMLMECQHLPESDMKVLCERVPSILLEESKHSTCIKSSHDLRRYPRAVLGSARAVEEGRNGARDELYLHGTYVFLRIIRESCSDRLQGDFVDRGHYSLETVSLLLVLKAKSAVSTLAQEL